MYDLEDIYDEQIAPLMAQIIAICKQARMPMIASFAYRCDANNEHDLCTSFYQDDTRPAPAHYQVALRVIYGPGKKEGDGN